jgi:hypothetical protein
LNQQGIGGNNSLVFVGGIASFSNNFNTFSWTGNFSADGSAGGLCQNMSVTLAMSNN